MNKVGCRNYITNNLEFHGVKWKCIPKAMEATQRWHAED
jgi:hypothetical protein